MQLFYKGVNHAIRVNIDAAVGGTIMSKTPKDALDLFEEMVNIKSLLSNERTITKKAGAIKVDSLTMLNAKLDALTKRMDKVNVIAISTHPSWRNHPNLSWGNQGNNQWRP